MRFIDPDGMENVETDDAITYTGQDAVDEFQSLQQNMQQSNNANDGDDKGDKEKDARNYKNLKDPKGYNKYRTISDRADFYTWADKQLKLKGFDVKWAGAAAKIANEVELLTEWYSKFGGYSSNELSNFAEEGNAKLFNDVFDKLNTLLSGEPLKGSQAKYCWAQEVKNGSSR